MGLTAQTKLIILGVSGAVIAILGAVLGWYVFPTIVNGEISHMMVVSEDNHRTYDGWVTPPVPVYMQFYLFNVTNPDDIVKNGAKPKVTQVGPFTYRETRTKENISFSDDGTQVTYWQKVIYTFDEGMSPGLTEETEVTVINAPMVGVATMVEGLGSKNLPRIIDTTMANLNMTLFQTENAGDLIFRGVYVPILAAIGIFNIPVPPVFVNDTFALYGKNGTLEGPFTVYTGKEASENFTIIKSFNYSAQLPFWNTKYCNMINGTDGLQFPPFISKKQKQYLFNTDLCRSLYATYQKNVEHHGIPAWRFTPPDEVLADPRENPDNQCYCPVNGTCLKAGVIDISRCQFGAPVVMSGPHFYQGDPEYASKIDGMHPNAEEHETFLDLEPLTGLALKGCKRIQINIMLKKFDQMPSFEKVPDVIFPVLWVNESATIDEKNADLFKSMLQTPLEIMGAVKWVLVALGVILVVVAVIIWMRRRDALKTQIHNGSPTTAKHSPLST